MFPSGDATLENVGETAFAVQPFGAKFEAVVVGIVWRLNAENVAQINEMRLRAAALGPAVATTARRPVANKVFRGYAANVAGCNDPQIGAAEALVSTRFDVR